MRKRSKLGLAALILSAALVGCNTTNGDAGNTNGGNGNAANVGEQNEDSQNDQGSEVEIPDVPIEELRQQYEARLFQEYDADTLKVFDFHTKQQWIAHMAEITDRSLAESLADDYFEEKDGGLYIIPKGGPVMLDLEQAYEREDVSDTKVQLVQSGENMLHGKYELTINYEYRDDHWIIQDRTSKSLTASEEGLDLQSLLLQESGQTKLYHGYAEYGHNESLVEIREEDGASVYVYEGVMNDGSGLTDENGDRFSFQRIVTVSDDQIKSEVRSDHMDHVATSLFQEKIWIQKPLQQDHSWTENVTYQGTEYEATSTIVAVGQSDEGNTEYEVETIIDNIEGFPNNMYKEKIKFEEGKGVVMFQNTMAHLTDPLDDAGYTFGYGLSIIRDTAELEED